MFGVDGNTCGYSLATPGIGYDRWMTTVFPHLHSFLQKIEKSYMKYPLLVFSYIYCGKCKDFLGPPIHSILLHPMEEKLILPQKTFKNINSPIKNVAKKYKIGHVIYSILDMYAKVILRWI